MKDTMRTRTKVFEFKDGRSDRVGTVVSESFRIARDTAIREFKFIRPLLLKMTLNQINGRG
jgi:hypothetical protein